MSQDLKAEKVCDHKVVEDIAFLQDDRKTIKIPRIVAVSRSLVLKRDGWIIPQDSREFGWSVAQDGDDPGKKRIILRKIQKSTDDFFEVSYITTVEWCPKCATQSVYWDFVIDKLGRLVMVKREEKLIQDVIKGTFTVRGSNIFHDWYGTLFEALIGSKLVNFDNTKLVIAQDVNSFFQNLKDLQSQQAQIQSVDQEELLDSLISVNVSQPSASSEPTYIVVSIIFRNKAGNLREIREVIDSRSQARVYGDVRDKLLLLS